LVNGAISLLTFLGVTAPFVTTILGWVAVSQIRRSAGKLHGLWLAVFDGLLFPLLALDGVICGIWFLIISLVAVWLKSRHFEPWDARGFDHLLISILALLTLLTSAWADFLIIRRVWRAVNKAQVRPSSDVLGEQVREKVRWMPHRKVLQWAAFLLVLAVAGFGVYGCQAQKAVQLRLDNQSALIQQMVDSIDAHLAQADMKRRILHFGFSSDGRWGSVTAEDVRSTSKAEPGKLIAQEGRLHCLDRDGGDWWVQGEGPLRQVAFAMKGARLTRGNAAFPYASSEPYPVRTLTCASDGRRIQIPDLVAFLPLVRQMSEYKAWRKVRNMETFFLTTKSDYRFEAHFAGQARTAGGKEEDLIMDVVLFRPDRTRLARAFVGSSENQQWQMELYDGSGEKVLGRIFWKRAPGAPEGRVESLDVGPANTADERVCDVDEHAVIQDKELPFVMLPELEAILGETAAKADKPDAPVSIPVVSTNQSFGPVIERVLAVDATGTNTGESLNLETGRKTPHLRAMEGELQETENWMRDMNLDLRGDIRDQRPSVVCFDMAVMPVDRDRWEQATADELLQDKKLAAISPPLRVIESESTLVFRSRSGQTGILQITGFTDNPRGVNIRYKLVRQTNTTSSP
jgi:hypothetical protein